VRYTHDTWSIDLSNNWIAEETDECMAFYNPDGVGVIQISTYLKEAGDVTDEDLLEFAEVINPDTADLPYLKGIHEASDDNGDVFLNWWLRSGPQLFYVTYICKNGDELIEAEERKYAVYSLRLHSVQ